MIAEIDGPEGYDHYFTIFIPAYNRAYTLEKTLESIESSTLKDFEVLVMDDGSTDETEELIKTWSEKVLYPVKYQYQSNQGKPAAHNAAIQSARGFFFVTLDAGDSLLPEALSEIKKHWEAIPAHQRSSFAGVCGLCLTDKGCVSGAPFSEDTIDSDFNEIYNRSVMKNEKRWAVRLSVIKEYPYPKIEEEKHVRPTLILRRMAHKYKMRFINMPIQIERSEQDGIRKNALKYDMSNPKGHRLYFLEEITMNDQYHSRKKLYRLHVHYIRFSFHAGVGVMDQATEVKHRRTWLRALPRGFKNWCRDLIRAIIKKTSPRHPGSDPASRPTG